MKKKRCPAGFRPEVRRETVPLAPLAATVTGKLFMRHMTLRSPLSKTQRGWICLAALAGCLFLSEAALAQDSLAEEAASQGKIPTKNLLDVMHDGGPLMYPIGLCSFILFVFVFERFIALRRGRVIPRPFVKRILEQLKEGQLDREKALQLCEDNRSPVAVVFAAAVKKWGRTSVEVEQAILDSGERVTNQLRRHLRLFSGISQVSPLLGLLGTVVGMISSFNAISASDAMGQRELLAGGIAQALLTTAAGMIVAIPALMAYLYFVGRVDGLVTEIDSVGQQLVELISADGLTNRTNSTKSKSKAA
jgi:biopolymer transport protein ExbB